jgi:hypothetical protein
MILCFLGLLLEIGEIDLRFGVLDTDSVFQSYAGLFELLRIRAEFEMKVKGCAAVAAVPCTTDSEILTQPLLEQRATSSCSIDRRHCDSWESGSNALISCPLSATIDQRTQCCHLEGASAICADPSEAVAGCLVQLASVGVDPGEACEGTTSTGDTRV